MVSVLARALRDLGHEVFVAAAAPRAGDPLDFRFPGIPLPGELRVRVAQVGARRLARFARERGLDVLHSHTEFGAGWAARGAAARIRLPWVHTFHTPWDRYWHYLPGSGFIPDRVLSRWVSRFVEPAALVATPSERGRGWVRRHAGRDPLVVANPVDERFLTWSSKADARSRLGIPGDVGMLLMVGRVAPEKGTLGFMEAFAPELARRPDLRLAVIGAGRESAEAGRVAGRWNVADRVLLPGSVSWKAMGDWYRASDVFVSVSTAEFQSVAALEAMTSGLPVVCRDELAFGAGAVVMPDEAAVAEAALALVADRPDATSFDTDAHHPIQVAARWIATYRNLV